MNAEPVADFPGMQKLRDLCIPVDIWYFARSLPQSPSNSEFHDWNALGVDNDSLLKHRLFPQEYDLFC